LADGAKAQAHVQDEDDGMIHLPVPHSLIFDEIENSRPNEVGKVSNEKTAQEKGDREPGSVQTPSVNTRSPVQGTN
jgi:hypothetical protein